MLLICSLLNQGGERNRKRHLVSKYAGGRKDHGKKREIGFYYFYTNS